MSDGFAWLQELDLFGESALQERAVDLVSSAIPVAHKGLTDLIDYYFQRSFAAFDPDCVTSTDEQLSFTCLTLNPSAES